MSDLEFQAWPKIARLNRSMVVTEKIDGTNAAIGIKPRQAFESVQYHFNQGNLVDAGSDLVLYAQSRKRLITPDSDNYGFARWAYENAETLAKDLGPGLHFGEWWGRGIQRNYGLDYRVFSLFNVTKWRDSDAYLEFNTPNLQVVPKLLQSGHMFDTTVVRQAIGLLKINGSVAAPGFLNPEGVVVFHSASGSLFKVTLDNDEVPKGNVESQ